MRYLYLSLLLPMMNQHRIVSFQRKVFSYYDRFGRDLPWRKTTNPYHILLSEVMLQQTQVDRVVDYYERWMRKWPTIVDLAGAERTDVLRMWMGLGYNNRAVNIHKAVQKIVMDYHSDVLLAMNEYKNIPGIGPYISHAVRIFSTNENIVTVDTNIRRILIHEFQLDESVSDKELWELANHCLPPGKSREWHNALMDYGATLLTARKTGIKSKTQQSTFEGSDRQIRAKIVRYLLENNKKSSIKRLMTITNEKKSERIKKILDKMMRDELIMLHGETYSLPG